MKLNWKKTEMLLVGHVYLLWAESVGLYWNNCLEKCLQSWKIFLFYWKRFTKISSLLKVRQMIWKRCGESSPATPVWG